MYQIIRREILFGLIPKTLKRKSKEKTHRPSEKHHSAGDSQAHITRNAFNVLGNEGFLRDQGILNLESVQEFYKTIQQDPVPASVKVENLLAFCDQPGYNEPDFLPVINLTEIDSKTGKSQGHAVVLCDYHRYEDELVLTAIDSALEDGERGIQCPILTRNGQQKLAIGGKVDQWCLGSDNCYFIYFN